ncbi:uncharacterized protein LOC125940245 [Dermacentor silvarum]|uniref:uncharacterized protein LOC125940245 n=1 Tax=Dermacentor silvarum TaxID=543639 RepID=UPI00210111E6|nr:uncharacterized protein LOC125940245 [Dermacentor silvarum]
MAIVELLGTAGHVRDDIVSIRAKCLPQTSIDKLAYDVELIASHLKAVLKTMVIRDSPECYINQVRFLYDAVQPPDMGLKCGNFFKLDTPLVVTMAGAIITFAVILVQTVDQARN